jgi:hypothetical protein
MARPASDSGDAIQPEQQPQMTKTETDHVVNVEHAPRRDDIQVMGRDKAAQFLKQADHPVVVTPADNARVLRKIDWRILPIMLFVYCLQSLDKTTLSYASVFGLIDDTHLVGDQFSWLGSIVYLAQLVFQPLVAYSLVKFPVGKFSATMVLCWGAVLCGMTAAKDFGGLMAARLLLGAFEASVGRCYFYPFAPFLSFCLWRRC